MDFWEKLDRLAKEKGKAKVSFQAGLPSTAISNYLSKRQIPRADAAVKIGGILGVPVEWLMDDKADWPPPDPSPKPSPAQFTDRELMLEVAKRHRLAVGRVLDALDAAEKINWEETRANPDRWRDLIPVVFPLHYWQGLINLYSAESAASANHSLMPGSRPPSDFKILTILERINKVMGSPDFQTVAANVLNRIPEEAEAQIEKELEWAGAVVRPPHGASLFPPARSSQAAPAVMPASSPPSPTETPGKPRRPGKAKL